MATRTLMSAEEFDRLPEEERRRYKILRVMAIGETDFALSSALLPNWSIPVSDLFASL